MSSMPPTPPVLSATQQSSSPPAPPAGRVDGGGAVTNVAGRDRVRVTPGEKHLDETSRHGAGGRNRRFPRWVWQSVPWLIGLALALAWDRAVYIHIAVKDPARLQALNSADWYRTLRIAGAPWVWFFVAAVLVLYDAGKGERSAKHSNTYPGLLRGGSAALRRGTFLLLSALLSGGAAEIVKAIAGRYKPDTTDGFFRFASFHERFVQLKWNDLGFPSSHAALAFGACFAMSIMVPRARMVFVLMAIGCAVTRLLAGAHFLSDTYAAVLLAYLVTRGVYALDRRNNQGVGVDEEFVIAESAAREGV
ncbi:MAG: phosphatase PAP2 family protein [Pyrinomonadaceae bacterium]|nr:phosphatase PAP2 family protein [Phycisphaerales bacterium]